LFEKKMLFNVMMRNFYLITFIGFVSGVDTQLSKKAVTGPGGQQFPVLENLRKRLALGLTRRRPSGWMSEECFIDITQQDKIWCLLDAECGCSTIGSGHTKWVFQVDNDTEYMCFPSSCSASHVEWFWSWRFETFDLAGTYCAMECPEIPFNVRGRSDDDQTMSISGTYKYADMSYNCARLTAFTEMSLCEQYDECSSGATGFKTCTETIRYNRMPSGHSYFQAPLNSFSKVCLPDECTDEANLEKLEDFSYADMVWYLNYWYDIFLNSTEIREAYSISWSCKGEAEEKYANHPLWEQLVLIIGTLVLICVGAVCFLRFHLSRDFVISKAVGLKNRDMSGRPDRMEHSIHELDSSSESTSDYVSPILTNHGMVCGEVDHAKC